jgi:hypothetical protein
VLCGKRWLAREKNECAGSQQQSRQKEKRWRVWTPKIFQNLRQPSGETFGPTRPTLYRGGALNDSSDEAFIRVGGNFPNGGAAYFNQNVVTDSTGAATLALNPPGIGRNSFRGPQYFSVDLSAHKQFGFPKLPGLGENTRMELRANFFTCSTCKRWAFPIQAWMCAAQTSSGRSAGWRVASLNSRRG